MIKPLPANLAFIDEGRRLEAEAIGGGRRTNQLSIAPPAGTIPLLGTTDDAQETEERVATIAQYVPHAVRAYKERGLVYPFTPSAAGDSLTVLAGCEVLARSSVAIAELCGIGGDKAKLFEKRSIAALHALVGGWAIGVGAPRDDGTGVKVAVTNFRKLLGAEIGPFFIDPCPPAGDLGADGFWILGRRWGGPLVYVQVKNTAFYPRDLPSEFQRLSDVLLHWFGHRIDQGRLVVPVFAVNSVFTLELKASAFAAGGKYHVLDAVDILYTESLNPPHSQHRDTLNIM